MTEMLNRDIHREFSRRSFLRGGGALIVGFSLAGAATAGKAGAAMAPTSAGYLPPTNQVDSWLTVNADNTVVFKTSQIEIGNGVTTGLGQLVAEELDLSPSQVRHSAWDSWVVVNSGSTGGSTGIQSSAGPALRAAAATAKQALLKLASANLGVALGGLTVKEGVVSGGGKTVTYGQLLGDKLFSTTLVAPTLNPGVAPSKPVAQYTVVGTKVPRVDVPDKISGKYTYVHNVRIPGMLHGRVVRPRGQGPFGTGAPIVSVDEKSIAHIPGAKVVRQGDFLAVVAPKEYDAIQAAAQLRVTWKESPMLPTSGNLFGKMRADDSAGLAKAAFRTNTGNVDTALASAASKISSSYAYHYGGRAVIGPSCAVADVRASSATVYSSSQNLLGTVTAVSQLTGIPAKDVRAFYYEGASSYGSGQSAAESSKAAALMSKLVGAPVRMQLMRWDEHGWDYFQAAQIIDVRAGVDANGKLTAWDYTLMQQPYSTGIDVTSELTGQPYPTTMTGARIDDPSVGDAYKAANVRLLGKTLDVYKGYLRGSSLRSGGEGQISAFATEQAIDELAVMARMDPIAFRRMNIADDQWLTALDAAAKGANWQPKVSGSNLSDAQVVKGRGVGMGSHGTAARSAAVVDVTVDRKSGKITVTHIYNGIDAGLIVNPEGVENQMVGGAIFGLSRALSETFTTSKTRVTSLDWVTYPILRFKDAPKITNVIVNRPDRLPLGAGEPPCCPIPAAVANAFFDATGVRIRQAPMTPARVRATLEAAGAA
jgi:CO/xanthine dehydrogenase Mo-binding subunit